MKKDKKSRNLLVKLYGGLYEFEPMGNRLLCVYCDDTRESIDHIPALESVDFVGTKKLREDGIRFITVPCCRTCNGLLSNKLLLTYEDRLLYLYEKTLAKTDNVNLWSQEELEELGKNLQQMIMARQLAMRRELITRLRGMERRMSLIP